MGETNDVCLRHFAEADIEALYAISLLTGVAGGDATILHAEPRLIGEIYSAPYARLEPEFAFVAEDREGVAGYIVGAPNTRLFEARLESEWWPALRRRYADPSETPPETWNADQLRAYQIHHPRPAPADIVERYPAHLHMNLHPRMQGRGVGPRLLALWLSRAAEFRVSAVHLGTNQGNTRALNFWVRQGFSRIERPLKPHSTIWFGKSVCDAT